MIRNTEFFEQVEDYCLNQLSEEARVEFEAELVLNEELRNEVQLTMGIQQAITELDVLNLRESLNEVAAQNKPTENINSFQILDDFSDIHELTQEFDSEELINFYDSLPKAHVYQHERTANETVHQFYKKQNGGVEKVLNEEFEMFDDIELEGLEEAVLERDILDLRQTLQQVAKSVEPQFSTQDIDEFLNQELTPEQMLEFEGELAHNKYLQEEVNLHEELEMALQEEAVMNLRSKLANVMKSETSWNVSEQSIEDFIDGILEGELLEEFNAEFADNTDLKAEVKLRSEVNTIFGETDILDLRNALEVARKNSETKKVKLLIPEGKSKQLRWLRNSVAVILAIVGLAALTNNMFISVDRAYEKYLDVPAWTVERSAEELSNIRQQVGLAYTNQNFTAVNNILEKTPSITNSNFDLQFYNAFSYQATENFENAISGYTKLISQGENMFVEEAEWLRGLCYLKLGNETKAKQDLLAVIDRKGYYEKDAKAIIRRLRYTMK